MRLLACHCHKKLEPGFGITAIQYQGIRRGGKTRTFHICKKTATIIDKMLKGDFFKELNVPIRKTTVNMYRGGVYRNGMEEGEE